MKRGPSAAFARTPPSTPIFASASWRPTRRRRGGELHGWVQTADGALALLILLDQFPRNAFRNSARMFATDPLARQLTEAALAVGFDRQVETELRNFFYLPLMHAGTPVGRGGNGAQSPFFPPARFGTVFFRLASLLTARFLTATGLPGLRSAGLSFAAAFPASRDRSSSTQAGA